MSTSPEVITYMADADDGFDLPRWSNSSHPSHLAAQPTHPNGSQYSLYSQAAPPPPQQLSHHHDHPQLPSIGRQRSSPPSRHPPRLPLIVDSETKPLVQDQGSSIMQVTRSASMNTAARARRLQQPDDLERAYSSESQAPSGPSGRPHLPNPFYPSSIAYQQTASPSTADHASPPSDAYLYYGQSSSASRRTQTHDPASPPVNAAQPPQTMSQLDPYVQPQQQSTSVYSNTNYSDYIPSPQQTSADSAYSPLVKSEPVEVDMRASPYTPHQAQQPPMSSQSSTNLSYPSSASYPSMDTPLSHPKLSVGSPSRPSSHTSSNTPFSHSHGQMQHQQYYTSAPPPDRIKVESPPRRRSAGFKRVRDARELRPYVNPTPPGRRLDHEGNYLSVRLVSVCIRMSRS